ncbi:MAG: prenyltransferase/squalene oxidase repeat-containing protein [Verrucomicrobiales bacterium]|nr:prenyltransferase/squalene oxidase repeat-containing protein [Verrucomicrobiales bacterium]
MSLRLEMLQVARLAPSILGEEATGLVRQFVWKHHNEDGGFSDRDEKSDLYYTSFAIDSLTALSDPLPESGLKQFLDQKLSEKGSLDFVHLCCLSRCASALTKEKLTSAELEAVLRAIEKYRTEDGGYNQAKGMKTGSAYACFLAYGAYADHGRELPNPEGVTACLNSLQQANGAWANDTFLPVANVPATAAAVTLCRNLRMPVPAETGKWILEDCYHSFSGGLLPFPGAPLPDLLTTAVGLHALDGLQVDFENKKEKFLDFIDTLWTNEGGFHGSWEDDDLDIEYTYYGLLALGHLAL